MWGRIVRGESLNARAKATTQAIDIWNLGLVLFKIYYGKELLTILNNKPLKDKPEEFISNLTQVQIDKLFKDPTDPFANIIKNMLVIDPKERKMPASEDWQANNLI